MNWDQIKGVWKQLAGRVKEEWGRLTEDDDAVRAGWHDQFVGKMQERYGRMKAQAERKFNEFSRRLRG